MNNDLISRSELKKALKSNCDTLCNDKNTNWCEHCCPLNDFEDLIDNAPTVDCETYIEKAEKDKRIYKQGFEDGEKSVQNLTAIKVNIPEDIKDKLIEEMSKPRKVILDESKTVTDCIIAYGDGFESARRLFERPHGEWIDPQNVGANNWCSVCGEFILHYNGIHNYCSNCGADMRKGEDND